MELKLVDLTTAKLAKEKGFNIPVVNYYTPKGQVTKSVGYMSEVYAESDWNNGHGSYPTLPTEVECSAPSQDLLKKWLRLKHNMHINIFPRNDDMWEFIIFLIDQPLEGTPAFKSIMSLIYDVGRWETYDEAMEGALCVALERIS